MSDVPTPPEGLPPAGARPGSAPEAAGSAAGPAAASPPRVIPVFNVATVAGPVTATGTAVAPPPAGPARSRPGGTGRSPGPPRGAGRGRRSRWRLAFFVLSGVVVVGISVWALFGNRLLVVRSVSVSGTHMLLPAQVITAADVPVGTPLMNVDTAAVTRQVEALDQVASASVTRQWPGTLNIKVTERVPVMALKMADGSFDQVDGDGVLIRNTKTRPAALPQLDTPLPGGALRGAPAVAIAADVLEELQPWLAKQVEAVSPTVAPSGDVQVTLSLKDGKKVVWGGTDRVAQKSRELRILLPGHSAVIDVSSPGTVVTS
jgi:cell division protein FtsQ